MQAAHVEVYRVLDVSARLGGVFTNFLHAPKQASWRKPGAPVRAPGAAGAGAPHPHGCNYAVITALRRA